MRVAGHFIFLETAASVLLFSGPGLIRTDHPPNVSKREFGR